MNLKAKVQMTVNTPCDFSMQVPASVKFSEKHDFRGEEGEHKMYHTWFENPGRVSMRFFGGGNTRAKQV